MRTIRHSLKDSLKLRVSATTTQFSRTYQIHRVSYDHRLNIVFDRSWAEGWYNNAQPTEPRIRRAGELPSGIIEKNIREEMVELFQEKLRVSVTGLVQSIPKAI
jgi:hypothetical protein